MIRIAVLPLILFLWVPAALAQCGPGCPACSGGATETMLAPYTLKGGILVIPAGNKEKAVLNVAGSVLPWLELGAAYAWETEETVWNVKVQALKEQKGSWRPALVFGTGSVETGGSDQSVFAQLFKKINLHEDIAMALSGGYASDVPEFEERLGLVNVTLEFNEKIAPFYSYDGRASHVGLTWHAREWLQVTGYALEMEEAAFSVGVKKNLR